MEKTKLLLLCDDLWHPAEIIERGIASIPGFADKYEIDVVKTAKDILTREMIFSYPVIVCCKSNSINAANTAPWFEDGVTEVAGQEFTEYVQAGGGFLAVHSACVCGGESKGAEAFRALIGSHFVTHPLRCEVVYDASAEHPILKDAKLPIIERDEHYEIALETEDVTHILSSSSVPGGVQAAGYTREIGKGHLCVLTPGHTLAVWQNKSFQKIFCNAIEWCLTGEVK